MDYRAGLGGQERCSRHGEVIEKVKRARRRLVFCLLPGLVLMACSQKSTPRQPSPTAILQAIPSAVPAKYDHIQDTKNWRNPYLIIRADGVALYDPSDSAEIILKPEEVIGALAQLPRSNWPYGRVVAAAETEAKSDQDGIAIRRNKGLVGGLLEEAHVDIRWVPGT
jgi:hypothetical protein